MLATLLPTSPKQSFGAAKPPRIPSLGLRPKPQFLVRFGGLAAKTNQETLWGGFAAPNPTAGGG
jgi:hypothetical protein